MKLSALSFALAGGVYAAIVMALVTIASRIDVPGAHGITNGLVKMFGSYGYSVTWLGLVMSIIIGFVIGFILIGFYAVLYNSMVKK